MRVYNIPPGESTNPISYSCISHDLFVLLFEFAIVLWSILSIPYVDSVYINDQGFDGAEVGEDQ